MEQIKLTRTGQRPMKFEGEEIATGSTRNHNSTRWTTARVYRTKGGKYVLAIEYRTCWEGEQDAFEATTFDAVEPLAECLEKSASERGRTWKAEVSSILTQLDVSETVD